MTTESDLLRSICLDPANDGPRLVYADWLDENGDTERAEFIRVQIVNHHYGLGPDRKTGGIFALAFAREVELLGPHQEGCYGENYIKWFDVGSPKWACSINRGFPSEIRCTVTEFLGEEQCYLCEGTGEHPPPSFGYAVVGNCHRCYGAGFIKGLAQKIAGKWPVEKVVLTDARIESSMGNRFYYMAGLGSFPKEYWRRLEDFDSRRDGEQKIGQVCVDYIRSLIVTPEIAHAL